MDVKITKDMVKDGYDQNLIYLDTEDENSEIGVVCHIGNYWFYFDMKANTVTPDEYINKYSKEDIINKIYDGLEELKKGFDDEPDFFMDEYAYYYYYLKESLNT